MALLALITWAMLHIGWAPGDDCRRTYHLDTQGCVDQYQSDLDTNTPLADGTLSACLEGARRDYAQCVDRVWKGVTSDT